MPLFALPYELLLTVAENLRKNDLYSFIRTSRCLANLLIPLLHTLGARETSGHTPLCWAAEHEEVELVRILLTKGATLAPKTGNSAKEQATALHWAAKSGSKAIIDILLENGADINAATENNGETALLWAIREGSSAVVQLLLERGAKVNDNNPISSLLPEAISGGHQNIAKLLIENEVDVNKYGVGGKLPLHLAAVNGDDATVELLLDKGAEVDAYDRTQFQGTALHFAAGGGHLGIMNVLLAKGANIEARALDTQATPFHIAALLGQVAALEFLLDKGADIGARCEDNSTALHLAASGEEEECRLTGINLLVTKGADVNAQNKYGDTPLREPVFRGYRRIVAALLVQGGADVSLKDIYGDSILDEAEKRRDFKMARLLIRYGIKGSRKRVIRNLKSHGRILYYMGKGRKYMESTRST